MKNLFLTTSTMVFLGAAAHAQMVFDGGQVSLGAVFAGGTGFTDVANIDLTGNVAVSFGNIGAQADIAYNTVVGNGVSNTVYSLGGAAHAYYKFGNMSKAGAFYTTESLAFASILDSAYSTYGAEAMFDFGKLDLEVSVAGFSGDIGDGTIISADAFYDISSQFEVSAGVWVIIPEGGAGDHLTVASVGAIYKLENAPISIGAEYKLGYDSTFSGGNTGSSFGINVSYAFGAGNGERMFGSRNLDYIDLIFALSGA